MSDQPLQGDIQMPSDANTVTLGKPIRVVDRTVAVLTFREPTGNDLMEAGACMRFVTGEGKETAVEIIPLGMGKMIARLAQIPMRAVQALTARDFNKCGNVVLGFLGDETPESSLTDTLSVAITGETSPTPST